MRERRQGKLVAIASLVGRIPFPFDSIYLSTKFAVEGLVQSLKFEVEPYGIKAALIEPAHVSTGFAKKALKLQAAGRCGQRIGPAGIRAGAAGIAGVLREHGLERAAVRPNGEWCNPQGL